VPAPAPPGLDFVTFALGADEYALDLRAVLEVVRVGPLTRVPRAPDFVPGLMNLRGRIIPVVDLKRKLGMGDVDRAARRSRVIVAHWGPRVLGLLVDGATHVLHVLLSEVQETPEGILPPADPIVAGVVKRGQRLIVLVDVERLLGVPELGSAPS
jgi:purine-binding chemotaxis protein CheW